MSISDSLMMKYFELLSDYTPMQLEDLRKDIQMGKVHPKAVKVSLAKELISRYHPGVSSDVIAQEFDHQFREKKVPADATQVKAPLIPVAIAKFLKDENFSPSMTDAKRLVSQGSVRLYASDEDLAGAVTLSDTQALTVLVSGNILNVGKKLWIRII